MDRTEQPKEEGSTSEGRGNTEGTRGWDESGTREGLNQAVATCERVIFDERGPPKLFGLSVEYTVPTSANNGAAFLEALRVAGYIRLRPAPSRARRLNRIDGDVDWGDEIERDEDESETAEEGVSGRAQECVEAEELVCITTVDHSSNVDFESSVFEKTLASGAAARSSSSAHCGTGSRKFERGGERRCVVIRRRVECPQANTSALRNALARLRCNVLKLQVWVGGWVFGWVGVCIGVVECDIAVVLFVLACELVVFVVGWCVYCCC